MPDEKPQSNGSPPRPATFRLPQRISAVLQGAAMGAALWCMLFVLQLLPGQLSDYRSLLFGMLLAAVIKAGRQAPLLPALLVAMATLICVVAITPLAETMQRRLLRSDLIPAEGVDAVVSLSGWVNPDCGLKTRAWPETEKALTNMIATAKTLRTQLA